MFVTDLLFPGPLGPLAGLACCAGAAGALYTFRKKIPHPAECGLIGQCCLLCKCHTHQKFDLIVSVHEAQNLPRGSSVYLYVESGRFDTRTQDVKTNDKTLTGEFHERLQIHVRQMDDIVRFSLYKKLPLSSELVGSIELGVVKELIDQDFPLFKWYTLQKEGRNTSKIQLSFYKLDPEASGMSPLLQQAYIQMQLEAMANGTDVPTIDWNRMDPKERIKLLSKALEGPLKMMKGMGVKSWKQFYFRPMQTKSGNWNWVYWKDKNSCYDGSKFMGKLAMLAISNVLPDPNNRHQFYVKYHDAKGAHNFMFERVDRDRDIWADGLYEFLDRLRDYLEKYPIHQKKHVVHAVAAMGLHKRTKRSYQPIDPSAKRVPPPGAPRAGRAPKGVAAMTAMMYTEEVDEDEPAEISSAAEEISSSSVLEESEDQEGEDDDLVAGLIAGVGRDRPEASAEEDQLMAQLFDGDTGGAPQQEHMLKRE